MIRKMFILMASAAICRHLPWSECIDGVGVIVCHLESDQTARFLWDSAVSSPGLMKPWDILFRNHWTIGLFEIQHPTSSNYPASKISKNHLLKKKIQFVDQHGSTRFPWFTWQCVKTLYPCSSHQNSWDLWMFIPLKMVLIAIENDH
jgi:hypothetical protein